MAAVEMRVGSLFAGIGGFDLAFSRAGFDIVWWVENDPACRRVLKSRFPGVPGFGDITTIRSLPLVEILVGGFPCQDVSVAGARAGLAGARSGLFFEFVRLASVLRPEWLVIENVPGLLSSNGGRDMGTVLGQVAQLGYRWAYRVLDAQYFGVPQRRRRVFIVGCAGTAGCHPAEILFEPEIRPRDTAKKRAAQEETTGAITQSTFGSGGADDNDARVGRLVSALQGGGRRGHRVDAEGAAGGHLIPVLAHSLEAADGHHGRSSPRGDGCDNLLAFTIKDYGADAGSLSPTLRSMNYDGSHMNGGGQVGIAKQEHEEWVVRRLIPLECERLQGFPDEWTEDESDSARYRMLGNAVAVPVGEWIARRILEASC